MGSFLKEGMSSNRPPLFDGTDYDYWSSRMRFHVQAIDFTLWRIIVDGPLVPTKLKVVLAGDNDASKAPGAAIEVPVDDINTIDLSELRKSELDKISLNAKAVNILHQSLCAEEYGRIKGCETAKQIWDSLYATHVGTSQVKDTKIRLLTTEYETFKMIEGESISTMLQRLNLILNNLGALGKKYSDKEVNLKMLASLTRDYRAMTCAISESKDLGKLPTEDLTGSLLAYELELAKQKAEDEADAKTKKAFALSAAKSSRKSKMVEESDDESDDEDMAMFARKFRKFVKFSKQNGGSSFKKSGYSRGENNDRKDDQPKCFECNKTGHLKANCPRLKSKYPQKKAMQATWDNYTSGDDSDEEEVANTVCLMAKDSTEVISLTQNLSNSIELDILSDDECSSEDLSEAFVDLYKEHKLLLGKFKDLTKDNKSSHAQIEVLEKEVAKLKEELPKPKSVNLEVLELKQNFDKVKVENDNLKDCLKKFEVGEKTLSKILYSQHNSADRRGIGFEGPSTSHAQIAKTVFVAATSTRPHDIKKPTFSCTYCQKGNHGSHRCPIRKLCELGTLIPSWKKPRWIVKTNPLNTNPQGPNKIWVPRTSC